MDFMQQQIWKRVHDEGACRTLHQFMDEHNFDTDCFEDEMDLFGEENESNFHVALGKDDRTTSHILSIWRHQNIMSKCFATGFQLFYWKWYRTATNLAMAGNLFLSAMDLGGHSPQELSVYPHYASLKEEVIATGLCGPRKFANLVVLKATAYLESARCRRMRSVPFGCFKGLEDPLHLDIPYGSALSSHHIQSIVLYCDFTKICTLFSQSLRKNKWDDELGDVKARNAKFYYFSKSLRELVTYFGSYGEDNKMNGKVEGPFFSGVSVILNISEFSIGFNTPTSTSKTMEIAWRFAGSGGMVITVGNSKEYGYRQPLFNATWISAFVEEDEYFWFGSIERLSVDDITIVASSRVYRKSLAALYVLDAVFTGQEVNVKDVNAEVLRMIDFSIKYSLNEKEIPPKPAYVDNFVLDNLYSFCQKKTKVHLRSIEFKSLPRSLKDMLFYGFRSTIRVPSYEYDRTNIFRVNLFKLFPHLVELQLYVNDNALNLLSLLSVLDEAVIPQSFEVLKLEDEGNYWMRKAFEAIPDVQEQYRAKKWSIELQHIGKSHWIFIRKL